jgi:hypothetical protein
VRSSDQRYFHVQRQKRDSREWEQWSKALILALRDVRTGQGDFAAVEAACRGGAAEWSHVLIATGRTANDFRRNFRLGSPNEHRVAVNDLAELSDLRAIGLDGFSVLRLSKEQAKNVKLRWAKLHERDALLHDPQGAHWSAILGMWIDGQRVEHIEALRGLYGAGNRLVMHNLAKGLEAETQLENKNRTRPSSKPFVERYEQDAEEEAMICLSLALGAYSELWRKDGAGTGRTRDMIERNLLVVEAYAAGENIGEAFWNPDTSSRHGSEKQLRDRLDRMMGLYGEKWKDLIDAQKENFHPQ